MVDRGEVERATAIGVADCERGLLAGSAVHDNEIEMALAVEIDGRHPGKITRIE